MPCLFSKKILISACFVLIAGVSLLNFFPLYAAPKKSQQLVATPIDRVNERITKKPFGLYISPRQSPIKPERFIGYHTGVDFETFPGEQKGIVPIYAICNGRLIYRAWVRGYGGTIVESCTLDGQRVTVLYGHMKISSVTAKIGSVFKAGDKIGILGAAYSRDTNGERKHLHLGIHKGGTINLRGYVSKQVDLQSWLDFENYLERR